MGPNAKPVYEDEFMTDITDVIKRYGYLGAVMVLCDKKGVLQCSSVARDEMLHDLLSELGEQISQKMKSKEIEATKFIEKYGASVEVL